MTGTPASFPTENRLLERTVGERQPSGAKAETQWKTASATLPIIGWATVVTGVALIYSMGFTGSVMTALVLAGTGLLHATVGFLLHGGRNITAAGIFLFGMALFGYFPSYYYFVTGALFPTRYEIPGLMSLLYLQIGWYGLWARSRVHSQVNRHSYPVAPRSVQFVGLVLASAALGCGMLIGALQDELLQHLAQPFGYAGVTLAAVVLAHSRRNISLLAVLLIGLFFGLFVLFLFGGGGRLVLGSLAFAVVLAVQYRWQPIFAKPLVIAAVPPGLWLLAHRRSQSTALFLQDYRETGLESVVWPQRLYFQLLADVTLDKLPLGFGETFLSSATIWVPREMWPSKPVGFGAQLTSMYKPELSSVGHSEAALAHGEFVYNFGWLGLLVLAFVAGWAILILDRAMARSRNAPPQSMDVLIRQALFITLAAGGLDFIWVGSFTYVSRAGFTSVALLLLMIVSMVMGMNKRYPACGTIEGSPESRPKGRPRQREGLQLDVQRSGRYHGRRSQL